MLFPNLAKFRDTAPLTPNVTLFFLRACLHGGGGPQVGEVTRLGGIPRLSIQSLVWSPQVNVIKLK